MHGGAIRADVEEQKRVCRGSDLRRRHEFCMTAAMCPFCWKAKLEASTMKFDSLDIK